MTTCLYIVFILAWAYLDASIIKAFEIKANPSFGIEVYGMCFGLGLCLLSHMWRHPWRFYWDIPKKDESKTEAQ